MELAGRTALVTGASLGIGRATALALAARGVTVKATGLEAAPLRELAERPRVAVLAADLGQPAGVERVLDWAGPVDLLVNAAGFGRYEALADLRPGRSDELFAVDLVAPIRLTAALAPGMAARGVGHVVVVASIAGYVGVAREAVYSAAKSGLITFAESVRYELAGSGVGVTVVVPAAVATGFFARSGHAYGRRFPRPVSPARVAAALIGAVVRGAPEVYVPRWTVVPVRLRGGLPGVFRRAAGASMRAHRG
jgi:short-subunit dehydrogenase